MTALAGVMPGRPSSAAADTRLPATAGDGDAAAPTSDFARALSEAGAAGRPTHGVPVRGQDAAARQRTTAASLLNKGHAPTARAEATPALPGASPSAEGNAAADTDIRAEAVADMAADAAPDAAPDAAAATAATAGTALLGSAADAATLLAELQARHTAQATMPLRNEAAVPTGREAAASLASEARSETLPPSAPTRSAAAPALRAALALPAAATTAETGEPTPSADAGAPFAPEPVAAAAEPQTRQPQVPVQPQALPVPAQNLAAVRRDDDLPADTGRPPERAAGAAAPISNRRPAAELPSAASTVSAASTETAPPPPIAAAAPAIEAAIAVPSAAAPPLLTAAAVAPPPGLTLAPVAEARLSAPPGSAEFASQLGSQLTTFVRNGVQHARLHLNPDEMGPVTVQIRIDGQAAQVHLAAEHGLTRQALEQSMPLLAGSLREAGLTLSGGGVFEQPRQTRDQTGAGTAAGSPPGPSGAQGADGPLPPAGVAAPRRRGVVDLVA